MVVSLIPGARLSLRVINITLQDGTVFTLQTIRVQDLLPTSFPGPTEEKEDPGNEVGPLHLRHYYHHHLYLITESHSYKCSS